MLIASEKAFFSAEILGCEASPGSRSLKTTKESDHSRQNGMVDHWEDAAHDTGIVSLMEKG